MIFLTIEFNRFSDMINDPNENFIEELMSQNPYLHPTHQTIEKTKKKN